MIMTTEQYQIGYEDGYSDGFDEAISQESSVSRQEPITVRIFSFPESNGKRNWTAMFVRVKSWDGLIGNAGGITIGYGECWNRVAFNAEKARYLLGERMTEPSIVDYMNDVKTPEEWVGKDPEAASW